MNAEMKGRIHGIASQAIRDTRQGITEGASAILAVAMLERLEEAGFGLFEVTRSTRAYSRADGEDIGGTDWSYEMGDPVMIEESGHWENEPFEAIEWVLVEISRWMVGEPHVDEK